MDSTQQLFFFLCMQRWRDIGTYKIILLRLNKWEKEKFFSFNFQVKLWKTLITTAAQKLYFHYSNLFKSFVALIGRRVFSYFLGIKILNYLRYYTTNYIIKNFICRHCSSCLYGFFLGCDEALFTVPFLASAIT